jgi:2-keto-4-pentenoate hydratase
MSAELDPRVARGMAAQLAARRERLAAGERALGWKVGFGAPAAMERLGTSAALVGFLTDRGLVPSGGNCSVAGWANPVYEPEVAAHMRRDVPGGGGRAAAAAAIAGLGPALELADVDPLPADPEAILAGNIFHRRVVLGPPQPGAELAGVRARVLVDGDEVTATDRSDEATGGPVAVVAHVADVLAAVGERLRAGEVVITGSIVPPAPAPPGRRVRFELGRLGAVEVALTG